MAPPSREIPNMRLFALALCVAGVGCADPFDVEVRIVTDYHNSEVDFVRVELGGVPFETNHQVREADIAPSDDLIAGKRLTFDHIDSGDYYVTTTLFRGDMPIVQRRTIVALEEPRTLTLTIGRSCETIECGPARTCVSGICVSEGCSELVPELCPAGCSLHAECPADGCLLGRCIEGSCMLIAGDPTMCP